MTILDKKIHQIDESSVKFETLSKRVLKNHNARKNQIDNSPDNIKIPCFTSFLSVKKYTERKEGEVRVLVK